MEKKMINIVRLSIFSLEFLRIYCLIFIFKSHPTKNTYYGIV